MTANENSVYYKNQNINIFTSRRCTPSKSSAKNEMPRAIIHFIGGTFFGSYPLKFYSPLLEQIAQKSNSIVIATSVPITLSKNPLNHYLLSKTIAQDFNRAYRDVIVDEYGSDVAEGMVLVGLGHSLGSRLHTIICTSKKLTRIGFERAANVLLSFNNFSAVESVPGVKSLERGIQETLYGKNGSGSGRSARSKPRSDAFYDEYEIGLGDVVNAVSEGIQDQVSSIKTAITPDLDETSLEFQPSPQQLWDGIRKNYDVDKTLVVQFDRDLIDQSSRLATTILEKESKKKDTEDRKLHKNGEVSAGADESGSQNEIGKDKDKDNDKEREHQQSRSDFSRSKSTSKGNDDEKAGSQENNKHESDNNDGSMKDIRFARLQGVHLSPVQDEDILLDLSSSIARYITDIVLQK